MLHTLHEFHSYITINARDHAQITTTKVALVAFGLGNPSMDTEGFPRPCDTRSKLLGLMLMDQSVEG